MTIRNVFVVLGLCAITVGAEEYYDYVAHNEDEYMCWEERMDEVNNQRIEEISPGGTNCPDLVHTDAVIKDASECPVDGWIVYAEDDWSGGEAPVWLRRLRQPHSEATQIGFHSPSWWYRWSRDGEWILYLAQSSYSKTKFFLYVIKRDGSIHVPLSYQRMRGGETVTDTLNGILGGWYHNSPYEDPENGMFEVYCAGLSPRMEAWKLDMSTGTPTVVPDSKRYLANGIGRKSMSGALAAAGDILLWDEVFKDVLIPWGRDNDSTPSYPVMSTVSAQPTTIYTIPDGGRGTASSNNMYPVWGVFNCGQDLSWDGKFFIQNPGKVVSDCVPNGHHGFGIHKTKRYDEPISTVGQWWLEPENGAVSVNWAPEEVGGMKQWTAHNGNGKYSNWGNWAFSNVNEYVTGHNNAGDGPTEALCGWVIHWPTHTWYRYTEPGYVPYNAQLYIDEGVDVKKPVRTVRPTLISRKQNLTRWVDILGRKMPSQLRDQPKGVSVKDGVRELNMR